MKFSRQTITTALTLASVGTIIALAGCASPQSMSNNAMPDQSMNQSMTIDHGHMANGGMSDNGMQSDTMNHTGMHQMGAMDDNDMDQMDDMSSGSHM